MEKKEPRRRVGLNQPLKKQFRVLYGRGCYIKGVCEYVHCVRKTEREREGVADPPGGAIVPSSLHVTQCTLCVSATRLWEGVESRTRECLLILYREFK